MKTNTFDAQAALGFLVSQTSHIETAVNAALYPEIQYPSLIPVDTSAHPFVKSVTCFSSDKFGKAGWMNGNAKDVPLAGSSRAKHETEVHTAGIGYSYGWEELEHARMLGINLPNDDAMAARRAYEEMVDRVALEGDSTKDFQGLFNNGDVSVEAPTTGDWATATPDQVLADINGALQFVHTATVTTVMADTLLMPWSKYNLIATRRIPDTTMTILQFILLNNVYTANTGQPLTIRGIRKLDTAGAAGATRMIAYRRNPDVLKLHIPMPHRFLPAQQEGLEFVVPGVFRLGGLDIRRPKEVVYVDGI